jgi:hypothetical protein
MKAKSNLMAVFLGLALLVVLMLPACGGSSDDRAMVEKVFAAWSSQDVASIQQLYATDAVIYSPDSQTPKTVGIQAISDQAKLPMGRLTLLGQDVFVWAPTDKEMKDLAPLYQKAAGSKFLAAPTLVAGRPGLTVFEVRDGKVLNEWDTYMFWYE